MHKGAMLELSDYLASLALIISALAALYSRWSAKAAENANNIALHDPRVRIYLELRKFQNGFRGFEAYPDEAQLEEFYEKGVVLSELFFPPIISSQFNSVFQECWNCSRHLWAYENEEGKDDVHKELISEYHSLNKKIINPLAKQVKKELEIYNA